MYMARVDLGEVMRARPGERPRSHHYILILVAILVIVAVAYIFIVYGNSIIGGGNGPPGLPDYGSDQPPPLPDDTGAGSGSGTGFDNDLPPPPPPGFP